MKQYFAFTIAALLGNSQALIQPCPEPQASYPGQNIKDALNDWLKMKSETGCLETKKYMLQVQAKNYDPLAESQIEINQREHGASGAYPDDNSKIYGNYVQQPEVQLPNVIDPLRMLDKYPNLSS
ncbi:UNKNOWN [Stylonychia lemnae]|uniref:Uncharacterized protein n=1 Tax=Stylonychia lemnae TaxID=5949 RepID=A0A078AEE9_STYLE|nr:UNKNOWN [Stylonychia lemnae]|eukprot:CDW80580.1 UNKNOWN [Stylonychia lemnae]